MTSRLLPLLLLGALGACADSHETEDGGGPRPASDAGPDGFEIVAMDVANWPCALSSAGTLRCWSPPEGACEVGEPCAHVRTLDVVVEGAVELAVGADVACVRTEAGDVACYQPRPEDDPLEVSIAGIEGATTFDVAGFEGCAVVADGEVRCWAREAGDTSGTARTVDTLEPARSVAVGWGYACALLTTGEVSCWQVGDLDTPWSSPVVVMPAARRLSSGASYACAEGTDGALVCFGESAPTITAGPPSIRELDVGYGGVCVTAAAGEVWCMGLNAYGQVTGTPGDDVPALIPVSTVTAPRLVSAGHVANCALEGDEIVCWGYGAVRLAFDD